MTMLAGIKWRVAQSLEQLWWRRYLRNKDVEQYLTWKKNYWQQFLSQHLPDTDFTQLRIADVGCGPAGIFTVLKGLEVDAYDPLIDQYKEDLSHFNTLWYPNVTFHNIRAEDIDNTGYDIIFCINAINHVKDIDKAMDVLYAMTKNGGQLVISTDIHRYRVLNTLFKWIPGDALHPHQLNKIQFERLLTDAGFTITSANCYREGRIFDYWCFMCTR